MKSPTSSHSTSPAASFRTAIKVIELVNYLRSYLKPRVQEPHDEPLIATSGLEELMFAKNKAAQRTKCFEPEYKISKKRKFAIKTARPGTEDVATGRNKASIERLIRDIEREALGCDQLGLTFSKEKVSFIDNRVDPNLNGRTLAQLVNALSPLDATLSALQLLRRRARDFIGDRLICNGEEVMLNRCLDEAFLADLEHFTLRIRGFLVRAIFRKTYELFQRNAHWRNVIAGQLGGDAYVSEYASKPISTTFPWTIPSCLAVLWGVCWMFYDECGKSAVPAHSVLETLDHLSWGKPVEGQYAEYGRQLVASGGGLMPDFGTARNFQVQRRLSHTQSGTGALLPPRTTQAVSQTMRLPVAHMYPGPGTLGYDPPLISSNGNNGSAGYLPVGAPGSGYLLNGRDASALAGPSHLSPEPLGIATLTFPAGDHQQHQRHQQHQQHQHRQQSWLHTGHLVGDSGPSLATATTLPQLPSGGSSHHIPAVTVRSPGANIDTPAAAPQDYSSSNYNFYDPPYPQAASFSTEGNRTAFPIGFNYPNPFMNMEASEQQIMPSEAPPRDRLRSESSNHNVSDPSTPERIEPYTNRRGHTHKRTEEPPRDPSTNKMMCKHSECSSLRFERRCEWGKHMDKHDRPYKCKAKGCEKLQGFTYSGGLLRHQREVHKQNGGKSTALFCPEPNCKRNAGTGFTRKENLAEHVRRVHRRASASSEATSPAAKKDDEATVDAESSMIDDEDTTTDAAEQRQPKRKRLTNHDGAADGSGMDEELRDQIKRLRQADEENKRRIASLEALVNKLANR